MRRLELPPLVGSPDRLQQTIARRTQRVYDRVAGVYAVSTFLFHSQAHQLALAVSGIEDGMRVLEAATGSGEMFRRLVKTNGNGETVGFDLSPKMAAHTRRRIRREFPHSSVLCQAVDARAMPFREATFDAIVCCYLLELLSSDDISHTLGEFHRVLRRGGSLTLVCIGENTKLFNRVYRLLGKVAPAFWGRQIDLRLPEFVESSEFRIIDDLHVRQSLYPSRVIVARK